VLTKKSSWERVSPGSWGAHSTIGADRAALRLTGTSRTVLEDRTVRSAGGDGITADDEARTECTGTLVDGTAG
jgi:hypothetical protein